jgi:hypothetical protein
MKNPVASYGVSEGSLRKTQQAAGNMSRKGFNNAQGICATYFKPRYIGNWHILSDQFGAYCAITKQFFDCQNLAALRDLSHPLISSWWIKKQ